MGIIGVWLAVFGYTIAYTGIAHFAGTPNAGILASLGYGPTPAQQAAAAKQAVSPLSIFGDLVGTTLDPGLFLWNLITGHSATTSATTTTTGSSPGSLLV